MKIYICKIRLLGFPFCTASKDRADRFVEEDPESHYYDEFEVEDL